MKAHAKSSRSPRTLSSDANPSTHGVARCASPTALPRRTGPSMGTTSALGAAGFTCSSGSSPRALPVIARSWRGFAICCRYSNARRPTPAPVFLEDMIPSRSQMGDPNGHAHPVHVEIVARIDSDICRTEHSTCVHPWKDLRGRRTQFPDMCKVWGRKEGSGQELRVVIRRRRRIRASLA